MCENIYKFIYIFICKYIYTYIITWWYYECSGEIGHGDKRFVILLHWDICIHVFIEIRIYIYIYIWIYMYKCICLITFWLHRSKWTQRLETCHPLSLRSLQRAAFRSTSLEYADVYVYIYICMYMCMYTYIYVYIYRYWAHTPMRTHTHMHI